MEDTKERINTKKHDEDEPIVESDIELDNTDVVEPDNDPPQKVNGWQYWFAKNCNAIVSYSISLIFSL